MDIVYVVVFVDVVVVVVGKIAADKYTARENNNKKEKEKRNMFNGITIISCDAQVLIKIVQNENWIQCETMCLM